MLDNLCCLRISGYECHCGPSWEGKQCEILVKKCAAYPCNNGATCTDVGEDYFCTCVAGEMLMLLFDYFFWHNSHSERVFYKATQNKIDQ